MNVISLDINTEEVSLAGVLSTAFAISICLYFGLASDIGTLLACASGALSRRFTVFVFERELTRFEKVVFFAASCSLIGYIISTTYPHQIAI